MNKSRNFYRVGAQKKFFRHLVGKFFNSRTVARRKEQCRNLGLVVSHSRHRVLRVAYRAIINPTAPLYVASRYIIQNCVRYIIHTRRRGFVVEAPLSHFGAVDPSRAENERHGL